MNLKELQVEVNKLLTNHSARELDVTVVDYEDVEFYVTGVDIVHSEHSDVDVVRLQIALQPEWKPKGT